MAKDFDVKRDLMTVQQVMEAINARAPSTVTRAIKAKKLRAERLGSMGWLVYRDSVERMLQDDSGKPASGFPRGTRRTKKVAKKKSRR